MNSGELYAALTQRVTARGELLLVQIGAHTGFEANDPAFRAVESVLASKAMNRKGSRWKWLFVEPVPRNFEKLQAVISAQCARLPSCGDGKRGSMVAKRAAIVASGATGGKLPFYSISSTVDVQTGYDRRSGKSLPFYISQASAAHVLSESSIAVPDDCDRASSTGWVIQPRPRGLRACQAS